MELIPAGEGTVLCASCDALYLGSFPEYERIPTGDLHRFAATPLASYYAAVEDGFRGLAYTVVFEDMFFLLYLAVEPGSRGRGYGSSILDEVKLLAEGRRLFLSMEPIDESADNYGQRVSRRSFYERNGFSQGDDFVTSQGVGYTIMTFGCDVSREDMGRLAAHLVDVGMFPSGDSAQRTGGRT